jgi:HlyD family secretion protein
MKSLPVRKRTLALLVVIVLVLGLLIYVALRSGPLAPVSVTVATVEDKSLSPALFGIGTVEARYTYKIGPTFAGRLKNLDVQVGDYVKVGQMLGGMNPVDLDERIRAQEAALKRASAQLSEAQARKNYAESQALRYEQLLKVQAASEETAATKRQELLLAEAGLTAASEELLRARAERDGLVAQRTNLYLIAPVNGLVVSRDVDPGTTVVQGQTVVELIDPSTLWINVRFDQVRARGLAANLPAQITLRSQAGDSKAGRILRIEPLADVVTEEVLAKVVFNQLPKPLPPIGELSEVTVELAGLPAGPVIPNAAIRRMDGQFGVWQITNGELRFTPVSLGASDLNGEVMVREGLKKGDRVVVHNEKALNARSRIHIVDQLRGVSP